MTAFRCRDDSPKLGQPLRAQACRCNRQVVDRDGMCVSCGRFPAEVIDLTWGQQEWRLKKAERRSSPRPFREDGKLGRWVRNGRFAA